MSLIFLDGYYYLKRIWKQKNLKNTQNYTS